jgi:hypothetical protein
LTKFRFRKYPLTLSIMDHPRDWQRVLNTERPETESIVVGEPEFDARFVIAGPEPCLPMRLANN